MEVGCILDVIASFIERLNLLDIRWLLTILCLLFIGSYTQWAITYTYINSYLPAAVQNQDLQKTARSKKSLELHPKGS